MPKEEPAERGEDFVLGNYTPLEEAVFAACQPGLKNFIDNPRPYKPLSPEEELKLWNQFLIDMHYNPENQ